MSDKEEFKILLRAMYPHMEHIDSETRYTVAFNALRDGMQAVHEEKAAALLAAYRELRGEVRE